MTLPCWANPADDRIYAYENIDHDVNILIAETPKGRRAKGDRASMPISSAMARDLGEHLIALADSLDGGSASEYPDYPCPDDPDGLHHVTCGCSHD